MSKRNFSGNISGKGYYIALILCAVAIGISGYLYYRNTNEPSAENLEPTQAVAENPRQDVAAAATQPHNLPDLEPETSPTQPPVAQKPGKRVSPVDGETICGYAVESLSYNQTTRDWRTHAGVDIAAEAGTEVVAAADGEVYSVYEDDTMGTTVVLIHDLDQLRGLAASDKVAPVVRTSSISRTWRSVISTAASGVMNICGILSAPGRIIYFMEGWAAITAFTPATNASAVTDGSVRTRKGIVYVAVFPPVSASR